LRKDEENPMFLQILGADAADPSAVLISITSATMIVGHRLVAGAAVELRAAPGGARRQGAPFG
jgi:hypothetical protein